MPKVEGKKEQVENSSAIFYSRASSLQLAGFRPELRDAGRIIKSEKSLNFHDNMLITSNPEEINFIRTHEALKAGRIIECLNIEQANSLKAVRRVGKSLTIVNTESVQIDPVSKER